MHGRGGGNECQRVERERQLEDRRYGKIRTRRREAKATARSAMISGSHHEGSVISWRTRRPGLRRGTPQSNLVPARLAASQKKVGRDWHTRRNSTPTPTSSAVSESRIRARRRGATPAMELSARRESGAVGRVRVVPVEGREVGLEYGWLRIGFGAAHGGSAVRRRGAHRLDGGVRAGARCQGKRVAAAYRSRSRLLAAVSREAGAGAFRHGGMRTGNVARVERPRSAGPVAG